MTLNKKTLYIYINIEKYKVIKKTEQNKEAKKNGCASKVLVVGSSIGLSSSNCFKIKVFLEFQSCFKFQLFVK